MSAPQEVAALTPPLPQSVRRVIMPMQGGGSVAFVREAVAVEVDEHARTIEMLQARVRLTDRLRGEAERRERSWRSADRAHRRKIVRLEQEVERLKRRGPWTGTFTPGGDAAAQARQQAYELVKAQRDEYARLLGVSDDKIRQIRELAGQGLEVIRERVKAEREEARRAKWEAAVRGFYEKALDERRVWLGTHYGRRPVRRPSDWIRDDGEGNVVVDLESVGAWGPKRPRPTAGGPLHGMASRRPDAYSITSYPDLAGE